MSVENLSAPEISEKNGCIVCQHTERSYAFSSGKNAFYQCNNCYLLMPKSQTPILQPADQSVSPAPSRDFAALVHLIKDSLKTREVEYPCVVIATENERSLSEKLRVELPSATRFIGLKDLCGEKPESFGTVLSLVPLSLAGNTEDFFSHLRKILKPQGHFLFLQPMIDSAQAKLLKTGWLEWKQPHRFFPSRDALHILMLNNGFDRVWFTKARYSYSLDYIHRKIRHAGRGLTAHIMSLCTLLPSFVRKLKVKLPSSHIIVSSQLAVPREGKTLSIIVPVFNERATFEELMDALIQKKINGMRREIIIVESNSTDGTKELVKKYSKHPEVKIIWQEQAKGKGIAVREGLACITGDYVLIQDADMEYDLNDYENLLSSLRESRAMFVLGSRHSGNWRIREFNDAAATATLFNLGHVFFTWFVNLLTHQKMADPFTMFKVFHADILYGLEFTCKRFDFDHEMVIKFIRKGYQPLELPVNYRARSFAEGKKVSFIKDGLTWIYTDLRLRFGRLGKWPH